jgi:hypothetical protein
MCSHRKAEYERRERRQLTLCKSVKEVGRGELHRSTYEGRKKRSDVMEYGRFEV